MSAFLQATFAEVAPFLADYGYHPVPIKPGAKAPLIDDWQAGHAAEPLPAAVRIVGHRHPDRDVPRRRSGHPRP